MDKALQTMIDNMPAKTGKSLEEWIDVLKDRNIEKHSENVKILKAEYGVTHGYATTIISLYKDSLVEEPTDPVIEQYKGKENLKPIYDVLIEKISVLGDDIKLAPKKATVSLIRKRQFALIKPATKTRIDLGLKIKGKGFEGRLENSGPFGTMCTHRIKISDVNDVDDELMAWIQEAYDASV